MVRNFPTHGQPSAAQGSPTNCLSTLTLPFKLFDSSALQSDGPEVEHGAHFLILHYPLRLRHACATRSAPRRSRSFKRVPRRRVFRPTQDARGDAEQGRRESVQSVGAELPRGLAGVRRCHRGRPGARRRSAVWRRLRWYLRQELRTVMAQVANRTFLLAVRREIVHGCFAISRRFPSPGVKPVLTRTYTHAGESLGFVHRSRASFCRPRAKP
jgi:hypothetical protein